jgi:hypothetical protein
MSRTFQQACDRARIPLNDADKTRYPDADLLAYGNDAILILRQKRPDLFFGSWTIPPAGYAIGDNLPVDDTYFPAVCDYMTGRAEFRDDEDAMQQRAAAFLQLFGGNL